MTEERLHDLFEALSEQVPKPWTPGPVLWRRAIRRRRRRRAAAATLTATAVAVAALVPFRLGEGAPPPVAGPARYGVPPGAATLSSFTVSGLRVDTAPSAKELAGLPRLPPVGLPAMSKLDWSSARPLSQAPLTRAIALFQPVWKGFVYALSARGDLRFIDGVPLSEQVTSKGSRQSPLDGTSLAPDGRTAAFAQRDEVIIVDLTTGRSRGTGVPGLNEHVLWDSESRWVIVERQDGTDLINATSPDPPRGPSEAGGLDFLHTAFLTDDADLVRWTPPAKGAGSAFVRLAPDGAEVRQPAPGVAQAVSSWLGAGWRADDLAARAGTSKAGTVWQDRSGEALAVADLDSGRMVAVLRFLFEDSAALRVPCCSVAGWLDRETVLIVSRHDVQRLLAWNVRAGRLWPVADLPLGVTSFSLAGL